MRVLANFLLLLVAWFFLHCLWVVYDGFRPFKGKADLAIVLGTTAFADGSLSPWLQGRADEALRLVRNGQVTKIMVSGGTGTSDYPEGDAMRNYLVQKGVNNDSIIVDNYGDNTWFTASNFAKLDSAEKYKRVVVVTSFYHIVRTKWITGKLGKVTTYGASSASFFCADWHGLAREFFAYYIDRLLY